jgi:D-alanyl-D-alanine carboxypeptidase
MIMETKLTWDPSSYLKDWLRFRYEREDIPGFVVAVSQDGKTLLNESYGYADVEAQVKMTPEHVFRIASHSKTFTATAIMQLQEKGKLKIDDPVSDYLPWLKDHKDKRWLNVTIRQLLSHGAGVIRDGLDSDYWQLYRAFPDSNELKQDILKTALILDNTQCLGTL